MYIEKRTAKGAPLKRILPLLIFSTTTLLAQPPIPGAWSISGDVQGYPISETCTFTQTGDKVTGSCVDSDSKKRDTTIAIDGQKVIFVHDGEYEGQPLTLTYSGTWNDKGELSGVIDVKPLGYSGTFTAKKTNAK
jgi:hypothetical protein